MLTLHRLRTSLPDLHDITNKLFKSVRESTYIYLFDPIPDIARGKGELRELKVGKE